MSTYVVGDIQGCYAELNELLALVGFNTETDKLCSVGDLVNRGPENLETLKLMMSIPGQVVLGNHDLHLLAVATEAHQATRSDTFHDILSASNLDEIIFWLRQQPLAHCEQDQYLLVHAGIPAFWSGEEALALAGEVSNELRGDNWKAFLIDMYGNEPTTWHPDLSGIDRLRCITNYLTRMRFCTAEGELDLTHKTDIAPAGFSPWFNFPRDDELTILFGHWAAIEGITHQKNCIALDTGCVWGRSLTAYRLEDKEFFTVPARNRQ